MHPQQRANAEFKRKENKKQQSTLESHGRRKEIKWGKSLAGSSCITLLIQSCKRQNFIQSHLRRSELGQTADFRTSQVT